MGGENFSPPVFFDVEYEFIDHLDLISAMPKHYSNIVSTFGDLKSSCLLAGKWLTDVCQVSEDHLPAGQNPRELNHTYWKGACRGEYFVSSKEWSFFCPVWHTGQAIKSLVYLYLLDGDEHWLDAAKRGAGFILQAQVEDGRDAGLILAYEDHPDKVNVSAVLECLDGLFLLSRVCSDSRYSQAAISAAKWCRDFAWIRGEGLIQDLYCPSESRFIEKPYVSKNDGQGRPLVDDAVWMTAYELSGEESYRDLFYEVLDHLLSHEHPRGNWVDYGPCVPEKGWCHPRHAYWWGKPMLLAWQETGEAKWLDAAIRAGEWYIKSQRIDGGMFRYTDEKFNTHSFGQATSGSSCAAIMWMELYEETGDTKWLEPIIKSLQFSLSMQFTNCEDPNLKGCILEKVLPPDGTDRSPFHIRDVGTIFYIQAAARLLLLAEGKHSLYFESNTDVTAALALE